MKALAILLLALAVGSGVHGQAADSIVLGSVPLQLGMGQDEVLASLGFVYSLEFSGFAWYVTEREYGDVGNVAFRDRRLVRVNKHWSPPDPSAAQLAQAFSDAIRSVMSGDSETCQVETPYAGGTGLVRITCGEREVSVWAVGERLEPMVTEAIY